MSKKNRRNNNKKTYKYVPPKPCHENPTSLQYEIGAASIGNMYLGNIGAARAMARIGVDVMYPLDSMYGYIWDTGWRGEVIYYPIEDMQSLPHDILHKLITSIVDNLRAGKDVGIFCIGGHGRTGYIASVVIGVLFPEIKNPIAYVREHYCNKAVETYEQVLSIAEYLNKLDILDIYHNIDIAWDVEDIKDTASYKDKGYNMYWDNDNGYIS